MEFVKFTKQPIMIRGKTFCVCGEFRDDIDECSAYRERLKRSLIQHGGLIENAIVPSLDYIIIGRGKLSKKRREQLEACTSVKRLTEDDIEKLIEEPPTKKQATSPTIVSPVPRRPAPENVVDNEIPSPPPDDIPVSTLLTDKYAPKTLNDIVGNTKAVKSVCAFFESWKHKTRDPKQKNAILLCGKAGIGKTTLASVAAQHYGYGTLEYNASDTRNKEEIRKSIYNAISTRSIVGNTTSRCLIMDEVDGMSSGDKGGAAELCKAIKVTKIPIVCICNDQYATSMKTLKLYCDVINVWPPSQNECVGRLRYVAKEEGIIVDDVVLKKVAQDCNGDMRHCLVTLGMLGLKRGNIFNDMEIIRNGITEQDTSPFVAVRTVLGDPRTSLSERALAYEKCSDLMAPFVAENYIYGSNMDNIAQAANSIAFGDRLDVEIHKNQQWGLLPLQAYISGAIPGSVMQRGIGGAKITFPSSLGLYSKTTSMKKRASDFQRQFKVPSDELKYAVEILFAKICIADAKNPEQIELAMSSVTEIVDTMIYYGMKREDLDDVFAFIGDEDTLKKIPPKVKRSITAKLHKRLELKPTLS